MAFSVAASGRVLPKEFLGAAAPKAASLSAPSVAAAQKARRAPAVSASASSTSADLNAYKFAPIRESTVAREMTRRSGHLPLIFPPCAG